MKLQSAVVPKQYITLPARALGRGAGTSGPDGEGFQRYLRHPTNPQSVGNEWS